MIGMVLVTHGRLAEELRSAMEHVVGSQRNVDTVCIGPDDDNENRRTEIETYLDEYFFDQPEKAESFAWDVVGGRISGSA